MNRDQKRDLFEGLGLLAIVASLIFLALEIRQNTIQAQAAAIQTLGIATSEWFLSLDDRENRLLTEASYPEAIERWTLSDWEAYQSLQTAGLRWVETFSLQWGLLEEDGMALGMMARGNSHSHLRAILRWRRLDLRVSGPTLVGPWG